MATANLVAIGDIHLRPDGRNEQRLASWDRIIADACELPRLGAFLVTGDVFHAKSTIADRNAAAQRFQTMARFAPVLVSQGNHDADGDLDIFERIEGAYPIRVFKYPTTHVFETPAHEQIVASVIPYPHKGMLAAMGLSPDDVLTAADQALLDICRGLAAEAAAEGLPAFVLGHANISGAIASNGQPQVGREISLTAEHLAVFGDVPKVFGHVHRPQDIHGATYVGSVSRQDFGELEAKRFCIVSLGPAPGQYAFHSRPLDVPAMFHVEGTLSREGFAHDLPAGTDIEGAEVRVRYRYPASEQRFLDHASVRVPFAGAATLQVEPIAVPDRALRAPAVAQAVTLADKLTAWAMATDTVTPASVLEKLARLQTQDEATLRASVEAWLAQAEGIAAQEPGKAVAA